MKETVRGWLFLCSLIAVVLILVSVAHFNLSAEFTKFLTPSGYTILLPGGISVPALGSSYVLPFVVFVAAVAYFAVSVARRLDHRILFALLVIFGLTHIAYHLVLSTGVQWGIPFLRRLARDLIDPIDVWTLVLFGILYLRRDLKVGR